MLNFTMEATVINVIMVIINDKRAPPSQLSWNPPTTFPVVTRSLGLLAQVRPTVARIQVAVGSLRKGGRGDQRARDLHLRIGGEQRVDLRHPRLIQGGLHHWVVELRLVNGIELVRLAVQRGKLDVDEQGCPGRIRNQDCGEAPAVGRVGVDNLVGQAVEIVSVLTPPVMLFTPPMIRVHKSRQGGGRVLGLYRKALPIADDEVEVTDARRVEARVVDLD